MKYVETTAAEASAPQDLFQQLGLVTRQLHEALNQLGALHELHHSAEDLSDARGRLNFIARKTGEAADKVLTAVEQAKLEGAGLLERARQRQAEGGDAFAGEVEGTLQRIDHQLTDIMLAQDFHDLTGQVVSRVVAIAGDLEDNLLRLLVRNAAVQPAPRAERALHGPVVDSDARKDVVRGQGEVDDLLASLGF